MMDVELLHHSLRGWCVCSDPRVGALFTARLDERVVNTNTGSTAAGGT